MNFKFRYVPQYFVQSFEGDPRYARIEALVDEGRCDSGEILRTENIGRGLVHRDFFSFA